MFENKVLRKISGPKWDEVSVTGNGTALRGASQFVVLFTRYHWRDDFREDE
jgi:hypothetical protein